MFDGNFFWYLCINLVIRGLVWVFWVLEKVCDMVFIFSRLRVRKKVLEKKISVKFCSVKKWDSLKKG